MGLSTVDTSLIYSANIGGLVQCLLSLAIGVSHSHKLHASFTFCWLHSIPNYFPNFELQISQYNPPHFKMAVPNRFNIEHSKLIARNMSSSSRAEHAKRAKRVSVTLAQEADEKHVSVSVSEPTLMSPAPMSPAPIAINTNRPFGKERTKALVRKLDLHLIPFLAFIYL
jgi:hypothetical protein